MDNQKPNNDDNWNSRLIQFLCKSCTFYVIRDGQLGRCRKHAPSHNGWPAVFETDWCGDHKLNKKERTA